MRITVDRTLRKSVTAQVYGGVKQLIVSGDLAVGKRLPSSRTLARELGISRTTSIAVFERLTSEGLIVSRTGAGSFVSGLAEAQRPRARLSVENERLATTKLADLITEASPTLLPAAVPSAKAARLHHRPARVRRLSAGRLVAAFGQALARSRATLIMGYSDPNGLPALRQAIAEHLRASRGIVCDAEQIFIVNGAQQAFDLIGRVLLNPRRSGVVRKPRRDRRAQLLHRLRRAHDPGAGRREGLSVEAGLRLAPQFRMVFVTPSHQHPTGIEMSLGAVPICCAPPTSTTPGSSRTIMTASSAMTGSRCRP